MLYVFPLARLTRRRRYCATSWISRVGDPPNMCNCSDRGGTGSSEGLTSDCSSWNKSILHSVPGLGVGSPGVWSRQQGRATTLFRQTELAASKSDLQTRADQFNVAQKPEEDPGHFRLPGVKSEVSTRDGCRILYDLVCVSVKEEPYLPSHMHVFCIR